MQRLQELFWPHKNQALRRTIGWGIATVAVLFVCPAMGYNANNVGCLFAIGLLCTGFFGAIYFAKAHRDQRIREAAEAQRYEPGEFGIAALPTTPGSHDMFVPDGPPPESV